MHARERRKRSNFVWQDAKAPGEDRPILNATPAKHEGACATAQGALKGARRIEGHTQARALEPKDAGGALIIPCAQRAASSARAAVVRVGMDAVVMPQFGDDLPIQGIPARQDGI